MVRVKMEFSGWILLWFCLAWAKLGPTTKWTGAVRAYQKIGLEQCGLVWK